MKIPRVVACDASYHSIEALSRKWNAAVAVPERKIQYYLLNWHNNFWIDAKWTFEIFAMMTMTIMTLFPKFHC
jgi:hypothetical protein